MNWKFWKKEGAEIENSEEAVLDKSGAPWYVRAIFSKYTLLALAALILCFTIFYNRIDQTRFPASNVDVKKLNSDLSESEKCAALARSIYSQMQWELDSRFGWSANDILPTRLLDNRANRQKGVQFATYSFVQIFAVRAAKYGKVDEEYHPLKLARTQEMNYKPTSWIFPSSEGLYRDGIKHIEQYIADQRSGKAIFNVKTDDLYEILMFLIGERFMDESLGPLMQTGDDLSHFKLDDQVYYAKGVMLVVRDVISTLVGLYPELTEKGGENNIKIALQTLDKIGMYEPLYITAGSGDSMFADHRGKLARYIMNVRERIRDVAESINR